MTSNEIFIADVNGRPMSFTLSYSVLKSEVDFNLGVFSLDSYHGVIDFTFEDLTSAITFFKSLGTKSCIRYELLLGYRIKE